MFRSTLSGYKQIDNVVLNRSYISSTIQPYSTNVDIGSSNNRFENIYCNNYYALLAHIGDAEINNLTCGSAVTTNIKATNATIPNLRGTNMTTSNIKTINTSTANLNAFNVTTNTIVVEDSSITNSTITNLLTTNASVANANITSLNSTLTNITAPIHYTAGNLGIKHDFTLKLDNQGRLGTNDLTIVLEPLSQRNLTDYASFLGISLNDLLGFLGIDVNNQFIQDYTILSLEYDDDYFYERNTLLGKKLSLLLPSDNQVCFIDNDISGKPQLVGMNSFRASFGGNSVTIGNLHCNNAFIDGGTISVDEIETPTLTVSNEATLKYAEGDDLWFSNISAANVSIDTQIRCPDAKFNDLEITHDGYIEDLRGEQCYFTNISAENDILISGNLVAPRAELTDLQVINEGTISYLEGDNVYYTNISSDNTIKCGDLIQAPNGKYTNISVGNLISRGKLDADWIDASSITIGNYLVNNQFAVLTNTSTSNLYADYSYTKTLDGDDFYFTNSSSENLYVDNSYIKKLDGDDYYFTNTSSENLYVDESVLKYAEGNDLYFDRITAGNLRCLDKITTDFLFINGDVTCGSIKNTGTITTTAIHATTGNIRNLNVTTGSFNSISTANVSTNQLTTGNILCLNAITTANIVSESHTTGNILCQNRTTTNELRVNGDITCGSIQNTGTITSNKVVLVDTTPTADNEVVSKGYVDGFSYINAGNGINKSGGGSSGNITLNVNTALGGWLSSSEAGIDVGAGTKTTINGYGTRIAALEAFRINRNTVPVPNFTGLGLDLYDFYLYTGISVTLAGVVATATGLGTSVDGLSGLVDNINGDVFAQGPLGSRELNINPNKIINITWGNVLRCSAGELSVNTCTIANTLITNASVANLNISNTLEIASLVSTSGNFSIGITGGSLNITGGSVLNGGITTNNILASSITTSTLAISGIASIGNLVSTNASIGNIVSSNASIGNLTGANLQLSGQGSIVNLIATTSTISNIRITNISTSSLNVSGNISATSSIATIGNIVSSNASIGNLTGANLQLSGQGSIANLIATTSTIPNIRITNISTSSLNVSGNISATNGSIGNIVSSNASIGNLSSGNMSINNITIGSSLFTNQVSVKSNVLIAPTTDNFCLRLTTLSPSQGNVFINFSDAGGNQVMTIADADPVTDAPTAINGITGLMLRTISGPMILNTNLNERMRITPSGSIGIGTTSPLSGQMLEVRNTNASIAISSVLENQNTSLFLGTPHANGDALKCALIARGKSSWSRSMLHFCLDDTANNNSTANASLSNSRLCIDSNGFVGIGTTAPSNLLDVVGNVSNNHIGQIVNNLSTSTNYLAAGLRIFTPNASGIQTLIAFGRTGGNYNSGELRFTHVGNNSTVNNIGFGFWGDGTTPFCINGAGQIGIGTTSPNTGFGGTIGNVRLAIRNGTPGSDNGASVLLIGGDNNHYASITGSHVTGGNTFLAFGTANGATNPSERMRITNNGNVGIATSSPSMTLDVNGKTRLRNSLAQTFTNTTIGNAGNQTWSVANVESGLIVRSGLTGTTTDSMPALSSFTSAGYTTGNVFSFIVHSLSAQTYSLSATNSYNSMAVLTNEPKLFYLRLTNAGVDLYGV